MVAPLRGKGRGARNGAGNKGRQMQPRRAFNGNGPPPFANMMPPLMPPMMGPGMGPMPRPFPPRGRMPVMRGRRGLPPGPPRLMGPRGPPLPHPAMRLPPPGMRPPPPGLRPPMPPPHLIGRPHPGGPPIPPLGFRPGLPPPRPGFKNVLHKGKIVKKRKAMMKTDLTKPWVTEAIKQEFTKKAELLTKAKGSETEDDWSVYREQRDKCNKIYHAAEMEYIGAQEVRIPQLMPEINFPRITAPIDYTADVKL